MLSKISYRSPFLYRTGTDLQLRRFAPDYRLKAGIPRDARKKFHNRYFILESGTGTEEQAGIAPIDNGQTNREAQGRMLISL